MPSARSSDAPFHRSASTAPPRAPRFGSDWNTGHRSHERVPPFPELAWQAGRPHGSTAARSAAAGAVRSGSAAGRSPAASATWRAARRAAATTRPAFRSRFVRAPAPREVLRARDIGVDARVSGAHEMLGEDGPPICHVRRRSANRNPGGVRRASSACHHGLPSRGHVVGQGPMATATALITD